MRGWRSAVVFGGLAVALSPSASASPTAILGPFDDTNAQYTLVYNGSMEAHSLNQLTGWSASTPFMFGANTSWPYLGQRSGGTVNTWSVANGSASIYQTVTLSNDTWYVLSGYERASITGGGVAWLDLGSQSFLIDDGSTGNCQVGGPVSASSWSFVSCVFYSGLSTQTDVRMVFTGTWTGSSFAVFDEVAITPQVTFVSPEPDLDQDGWTVAEGDCDDTDRGVNPTQPEQCGGGDEDCDGLVDESDAIDASTYYADWDGDRYGDPNTTTLACSVPAGFVVNFKDCDDGDASISPAADEVCDGVDEDCDGWVDDYATDATTWYTDGDGDGYGEPGATIIACNQPNGTVLGGDDCDDTTAAVNPGATETCNQLDDDCDGVIDNDAVDAATWYADADGDGYGDPTSHVPACDAPRGYVGTRGDCDDGDATIHAGALETCDDEDDDCDGQIDDGVVDQTVYADADGDGYGDDAVTLVTCDPPSGYVAVAGDCDDADASVHPGADDPPDDVDQDCDGDTGDGDTGDTDGIDTDVADTADTDVAPDTDAVEPPELHVGGCACDAGGTGGSWAIGLLAAWAATTRLRRRA
jgi:hypothetical protein